MTPRELTAFRLDPALLQALRSLKERDDIPISEQVRRAVEDWLKRNHAEPGAAQRAFDDFEDALQSAWNRRTGVDRVRLPKGFGPLLEGRTLASLTVVDMDALDRFAHAVSRKTKAHRDAWNQARKHAREREQQRDMNLPKLTDDDLRRELFDSLVEQLKAEHRRDPALTIQDRTPMLQALSGNGHLLTVDQGEGPHLMRGEMRWRPGPDGDAPFNFSVRRSPDKHQVVMHPGPTGDLHSVVENIVRTFLTQSKLA
jgi:hypothetical protein